MIGQRTSALATDVSRRNRKHKSRQSVDCELWQQKVQAPRARVHFYAKLTRRSIFGERSCDLARSSSEWVCQGQRHVKTVGKYARTPSTGGFCRAVRPEGSDVGANSSEGALAATGNIGNNPVVQRA